MRALVLMTALAVAASAIAADNGAQQGEYLRDSIPARWTYDEHFSQTIPTEDAWWKNFHDATLDSLIAMGIDYNYNAAMALKRIDVAAQNLAIARSAYYPTVNANAGFTATRQSGMTGKTNGDAMSLHYFSIGLSASWEIDVFGRISKRAEAQRANINISRAEYAAVQVSIAANIANAYITLRTYQAQLAVARKHIASQQHILDMTMARHEAGLASMLDVSQARVVLYSTEASIPGLEAAIKATINSIAVLTGNFLERISMALATPQPLPDRFHLVGIGMPADLLRRRPDIIEAEMVLAADAANLGIAKKDFLPTLTLNGSVGTSARNAGDLFKNHSFTYTVAPTLSWTIFSGMSRKYAVIQAREQMEADIDSYNLTVQTAVEEVDNAIITYAGTLDNIDLLEKTVDEAQKSLDLSVDLYRNSLSSFTNVVTSQMSLLTYQNNLVAAQGKALQSLVNLYKALGGGWTVDNLK